MPGSLNSYGLEAGDRKIADAFMIFGLFDFSQRPHRISEDKENFLNNFSFGKSSTSTLICSSSSIQPVPYTSIGP